MREAASFSIYLPPGPPSRPAFSIEYDFGQSIYEIATSNDNSSNLNKSNLILNHQCGGKKIIVTKLSPYMMVLKFYELTSFLSAIDEIEI